MTFIDFGFLIFLLGAFAVFYICPKKYRWIALLAISIVFYAIAGVKYIPFIFVTSLSVWLGGRAMGLRYEKQNKELSNPDITREDKKVIREKYKKVCKKYVALVIIFNLAILCVVKFTKFFVGPINDLIGFMGGKEGSFSAANIIVPLGISYYTFSSISYLLDVFWKRTEYEKNYFRFLLYLIYFPHILQGPIERYGRLGARLKQELTFDWDRIVSGIQLMVWGYFQKLVIADRITLFITDAYKNYKSASGSILLIAMLLDVVYIYTDFSGCMDIARGVSQIFGVELDLNFNHPFASKSIVEFWRRWHMSLGGWFKDYVYYPVSTSRAVKSITKATRGKLPPTLGRAVVIILPVFVTWTLTGVWHGTGKTYVAWGIYYAIMIFLSTLFEPGLKSLAEKLKINTEATSWRYYQMARTTLIFAGGRLLTRPGSLSQSFNILKTVILHFNISDLITTKALYNYGLNGRNIIVSIIAIAIFAVITHLQMKGSVREMLNKQNVAAKWLVYILLLFVILIFGIYGPGYDASSFVYMAY